MLNAALFVFDIYFVSVGSDNRRGRPFLTLWLREAVPARAKVGVAVDFKGGRGKGAGMEERKGRGFRGKEMGWGRKGGEARE